MPRTRTLAGNGRDDFFDELDESPYPDRQHAFASHLVLDPHGNTVLPMHQDGNAHP